MQPTDLTDTRFCGPVFLVGMPRSGTKLLRNLLNQHARIAIPRIETEFLPMWVDRWSTFGDLASRDRFQAFYSEFCRLPYARYSADGGRLVDPSAWFEACRDFSTADVFETLIRLDAGAPRGSDIIWGDKSPSYIRHMSLLKAQFPQARFIHLIRDVRDYALSIRQAWRKNIYRAAQRWADDVRQARVTGAQLGRDYLEVRYEDLLRMPEEKLRAVSAFLEIQFDPAMLQPPSNTENLGDARSATGILDTNLEKYKTRMSARERHMIEAIAGTVLRDLGYACEYEGPVKRLSGLRLRWLQLVDGINLIRFRAARRGLADSVTFYSKYFRSSGNRY